MTSNAATLVKKRLVFRQGVKPLTLPILRLRYFNPMLLYRKTKEETHFCASPLVNYDLELLNFYTDYCKLLKFIEYLGAE